MSLTYSVFPDFDKTIATDDIGIYLFVIRPEERILELPQFVMYVGIAGEGGSNRPLKTRLSDYYNINNIRKRKKLHSMLKKYYNNTLGNLLFASNYHICRIGTVRSRFAWFFYTTSQ